MKKFIKFLIKETSTQPPLFPKFDTKKPGFPSELYNISKHHYKSMQATLAWNSFSIIIKSFTWLKNDSTTIQL